MALFLPSLKANGHLDQVFITVVNVGSRKISPQDDYASQGWGIFAPNLTIYGFDADGDACEAANAELERQQVNWTEKHIPLALGNSIGESTLYVTKHPMCSSLYPPNEPLLGRFAGLPELVNLDYTVEMETTTLNHFCCLEGIDSIDFLQIDVQGADLQVLQGASNLLETVLAIQIEVEFTPLYLNQPLFADVDNFLRAKDFSLFDLYTSRRVRRLSPCCSKSHPGQLLWADAFYLCDLLSEIPMSRDKTPERLFKLACIADALDFTDYALEILTYLTLTQGKDSNFNFANIIVDTLSQIPDLQKQGLDTLEIMAVLQPYLL